MMYYFDFKSISYCTGDLTLNVKVSYILRTD